MFIIIIFTETLVSFITYLPLLVLTQWSLARISTRHNDTAAKWHITGVYMFCFFLIAMLSVTGIPSISSLKLHGSINAIPFAAITGNAIQYLQNFLLFIPFGVLLPLLWSRFASFSRTLLVGFLFSLAIECIQLFSYRAADIDDLMMNTLGAIAGYGLFRGLHRSFPNFVQACRRKDQRSAPSHWLMEYEAYVYIGVVWFGMFVVRGILSAGFMWWFGW
ncbi:VanZ family protein [Paenibacillus donghaensis]|uniref:VanZ-like domain-containing protein n=1 Tax=Paenibacillus donghaensis TaxID=414771 RepID=A0A2Z2KI64_9BACL|nr:VanZ family protein [Paenibacillus donghaensis]ASA19491.1 hypothetical protein B9T62_00665 [Paenibacillus donghaensis]